MKRILVTFATFAGSTVEVARTVAQELTARGFQVDVLPLDKVGTIRVYDGVIVGAPMIMGWHRSALAFLSKHRRALEQIPFAVFITAMSLTQTGETSVRGVPVMVDPHLPQPPTKPGHLSLRERYARVSHYVPPILDAVHPAIPQSVGLFGGRLEYGRLKWWAVIFVMLIIRAPAGDKRNWEAIKEWASSVADLFGAEAAPVRTRESSAQDAVLEAA